MMTDIRTSYSPKPIGIRNFDWEAVDYETLDCDSLVGHGSTEAEAIADLVEQMEELEAQVIDAINDQVTSEQASFTHKIGRAA